jgi:hypothetical protein
MSYPMIGHMAAQFKALKRFHLEEIVATDTIFLSINAIGGGEGGGGSVRTSILWAHLTLRKCLWNGFQKSSTRGLQEIYPR